MNRNVLALTTLLAMLAFAANSLLCRLALGAGSIDAASFAAWRMIAGAITLVLLLRFKHGRWPLDAGTFRRHLPNALMLFLYMTGFSFAYLSLPAGTGALILFGAVQLTMFIVALKGGEHFSALSWAGWVLAIAGLFYLVMPGLHAPDPLGAILMAVAGIAWGIYSLLGRQSRDPLATTAVNFILGVPLVLAVLLGQSLLASALLHAAAGGIALAIASGAIASGCGYVLWYAVLPQHPATRAAAVQLSVPAIAALGGVLLLGEEPTLRLLLAAAMTLGGVGLVLIQRAAKNR